jgi:predicted RNA-binding Zn-ribbon protein involved in translation (DUF1610 family)
MRYNQIFRIFVLLALTIANFFPLALNVHAGKSINTGTLLKIEMPKSAKVAEAVLIDVQLTTFTGELVPNQTLHFYIDGVKVRSAKTNFTGRASIVLKQNEVGNYLLRVVYGGSKKHQLAPSNVGTALLIKPAIVEVQTLPALPGIKFSLGGQVVSSNADGIADIEVSKVGTYRLEVLPGTFTGPNFRATFSRWGDQTFLPYRDDITIPNTKILQAGFDVSYLVSHDFTNLQGNPVDPSLITSLTLRGSNGKVITLKDNQPQWLQANRVVRLGTFQETKILYSVADVQMKGSNVVSNAQQRFFVHPNDKWTINLLLYTANFTTHDMLFDFPVASRIDLEFPNGQIQALNFSKNEIYTAGGLPRGNYRATAFGPWGLAPSTPIALSRNQNVDLQVISYLDMILVVILGLSLVLGLLFIGRPEILASLLAISHRQSPAFAGNWKDTFQIWRLNWRSLSKPSPYMEVSPVIYDQSLPDMDGVLIEEKELPIQSDGDLGEENNKNLMDIQLAKTASCPVCGSKDLVKMGRGRLGRQRVHCNNCGANRTLNLTQGLDTQGHKSETS